LNAFLSSPAHRPWLDEPTASTAPNAGGGVTNSSDRRNDFPKQNSYFIIYISFLFSVKKKKGGHKKYMNTTFGFGNASSGGAKM
jgi:hypothetical protein